LSVKKLRLYSAGLLAFLVGVPMTEQALAQTGDIINASLSLAAAIIDSAGRS
jgi:hypothetical protein